MKLLLSKKHGQVMTQSLGEQVKETLERWSQKAVRSRTPILWVVWQACGRRVAGMWQACNMAHRCYSDHLRQQQAWASGQASCCVFISIR